mmetsp:Transcript_890/g.1022  ORF Transcript_890/g.1022 Transcript_890/m.1022 type:complete len:267 (+) Transcript_890:435-1235(+)
MLQRYTGFTGAVPASTLAICTLAITTATLAITLTVSKSLNHTPKSLFIPPLSLTGNHAPESFVYIAGLGTAALVFLTLAVLLSQIIGFIRNQAPNLTLYCNIAVMGGYIAAVGLGTQAIVPLQHDILDVIEGQAILSTQSIIHQGGAGAFFFGSLAHALCVCYIYHVVITSKTQSGALVAFAKGHISLKSYYTKLTCTCFVCITIVAAMILHPASGYIFSKSTYYNIGGATQWTLVLALIGFFGSYYWDLDKFYIGVVLIEEHKEP